MKRHLLIVCIALGCAPLMSDALAQKPSLNVVDFGAKGDGKTLNTRFLQAAIDSCEKRGGGAIVIPAGRFLTGTLFLKSNLRIHIESGGELLGSPNLADYDKTRKHLLFGKDIQNFAITGKGVIDGNGKCFFDEKFNALDRPAPFIVIEDGEDLSIRDVKLQNSPAHSLVFSGCNRVVVDGVTILNEMRSPNTDGIDITSSSNVMISNCFISTGDDAICLKTYHPETDKGDDLAVPTRRNSDKTTENVVVTNCVIESDDGALKLGTGSGTAIRYCSFSNIVIRNARFGIALFMKDGGVYEHLRFSNIQIQTASRHATEYPIFIDIEKRDDDGKYGAIRSVRFSNIDMQTRGNCLIAGQAASPLEDFTFENITLRVQNAVDVSKFKKPRGNKKLGDVKGSSDFAAIPAHFTLGHAKSVVIKNFRLWSDEPSAARHAIALINAHRSKLIEFETLAPQRPLAAILLMNSGDCSIERSASDASPFLKVEGDWTGQLRLIANRVQDAKDAFLLPKSVSRKQIIEQGTMTMK